MSSLGSSPAANSSSPIRAARSAFAPEFKLLLACSAVGKQEGSAREGSPPERASDDLRACLEVPLDWQRVLALAEHHSVTPPVYQALREITNVNLPNDPATWRNWYSTHGLEKTREFGQGDGWSVLGNN